MGTNEGSRGSDVASAVVRSVAAAGATSGGNLVAMGVGALAGAAGELAVQAFKQIRTGLARDRGVEGPLCQATLTELEEHRLELESKLETLLDQAGDEPAGRARVLGSFEALIHAWIRASQRAADDRKRRILMAALVSGLDEDAYREGLQLTVLDALERLDYGAIRCLSMFTNDVQEVRRITVGSLEAHHARTLESLGLIARKSSGIFVEAELGRVLLRFIHEELQDHMRSESSGTPA